MKFVRVSRVYARSLILVAAVGFSVPANAQTRGYDRLPTFSATKVLPANLRQSPHHRIVDPVTNDGFLNTYRMSTNFGEYEVKGTDLLKLRVLEAEAAAKLSEKGSGSQIFRSAGHAASKPLKAGKDLVTQPGRTIKGAFKGVGRLFGRVGSGTSATDPQRESFIGSISGAGETKRRLAHKLGVDPYSQFPPLNQELSRLSKAGALGGIGTKVGFAFVSGGAGIAISVGSNTHDLRQRLRDNTASDLEKFGRRDLTAMGVSPADIDKFYLNPYMTPTDKTIIVDALSRLKGVANRDLFVAQASQATSLPIAFSLRRRIYLTAAYHEKIKPVTSLVELGGVPMAQTATGFAAIFPVDYLSWTKKFASMARAANKAKRSISRKGKVELWITGKASRRAASQLKSLGWRVVHGVDGKLGA